MKKSRYKKLTNCTIDELADMVDDLENISIHCLKEKKLSMRRLVLTQIHDVKKEIEKRLKKQYNKPYANRSSRFNKFWQRHCV